MAVFTYNSEIFTRVDKWDSSNSYNGILLADKINQKNGQNYKLVDAVDIDWDGMWVSFASTYVNDTEDLLDILRFVDPTERFLIVNQRLSELQETLTAGDNIRITNNIISTYNLPSFAYVFDNYSSYAYLYEYSYSRNETVQAINDKIIEIIGSADINFDSIQEISEWIMSQIEYIPIDYRDIDTSSDEKYYIYEGDKYVEVDARYIEMHSNKQYYIARNLTDSLVGIKERLDALETKVGNVVKEANGSYTYTGIMYDLHKLYEADLSINSTITVIQYNLSQLSSSVTTLSSIAETALTTANAALNAANAAQSSADAAQETANAALTYSELSLEKIGTDIIPAHFELLDPSEVANYDGTTYILTINGYVSKTYDSNLIENWYKFVPKAEATGMRKELNDLSYGLDRSLFNIHIDNTDAMSYVYLGLTPEQFNGNRERTLKLYAKHAEFSLEDRKIHEDGIVTATNVNSILSYVIDWIDIDN